MVCLKATSNVCTGTATGEPCIPMLPETGLFVPDGSWIASSDGSSITISWTTLGQPTWKVRGHLRKDNEVGYNPANFLLGPFDTGQMTFDNLTDGEWYRVWVRIEDGTEAGQWVTRQIQCVAGGGGIVDYITHQADYVVHNGVFVVFHT